MAKLWSRPFRSELTSRKPVGYREVADGIRAQIVQGVLAPGTRLPPRDQLAREWKTSYGTLHNALHRLAKEGWLDRFDGSGTFVSEVQNRFTCAAIYEEASVFAEDNSPFPRILHNSLIQQLTASGKEARVFMDPRPAAEQVDLLPALAEAIAHRRVQCVIAPTANLANAPALNALRLPTAFMANPASPYQVIFDRRNLLSSAVGALKAQGCRSIGVVTHISDKDGEGLSRASGFFSFFRQAAMAEGITIREEWIRRPDFISADFERIGYDGFNDLWKLPEKPDGLIAFPDIVVRGVITAILSQGAEAVLPRMKFVFHQNAHFRPICPFRATWAISDIDQMARELIALVQSQFDGKKTSPVLLNHSFEEAAGES